MGRSHVKVHFSYPLPPLRIGYGWGKEKLAIAIASGKEGPPPSLSDPIRLAQLVHPRPIAVADVGRVDGTASID